MPPTTKDKATLGVALLEEAVVEVQSATSPLQVADITSCNSSIRRLEHFGSSSRIDERSIYSHHRQNGTEVPEPIYIAESATATGLRSPGTAIRLTSAWSPTKNACLP